MRALGNSVSVRFATRLYPRSWQRRYRSAVLEDVRDLLASGSSTTAVVVNLILGAIYVRQGIVRRYAGTSTSLLLVALLFLSVAQGSRLLFDRRQGTIFPAVEIPSTLRATLTCSLPEGNTLTITYRSDVTDPPQCDQELSRSTDQNAASN